MILFYTLIYISDIIAKNMVLKDGVKVRYKQFYY